MADEIKFRIPKKGLDGIKALIALGPEKIEALRAATSDLPPTLDLERLSKRLAFQLEVAQDSMARAIIGALVPLNQLRVSLKLEPSSFLNSVSITLEAHESDEWNKGDLDGWKAITAALLPLFEKDNYFSITNKSYQLLVNRPRPVQSMKILSELRPVYSEEATSVHAFVLAYTLAVEYLESSSIRKVFLSLDLDDIRNLAAEVDRAKLKYETLSDEIYGWGGASLLTYGQFGGADVDTDGQ